MRHAALLLLLCACSSLSSEQRDQLASHVRNAKFYYEGGRLDQALGQIDRGLSLDPDNYTLRTLRGAALLRQSSSALGTDHRMLDEATAILQDVYEERSPARHEPSLLLSYALALQKQGRRHLGEEVRLRGQASRSAEPDDLIAQADEQRSGALERLHAARAALEVLVERGEVVRVAHNHLMQIAHDLGDDVGFAAAGTAYLTQCSKDQAAVRTEIERTKEPVYEAEQIQNLRAMQNEEIGVRSLIAEHHFARQQFEQALTHLDRILEIDPQRTVDYYNRGRVLLEMHRNDDAKADFRRFLAMPEVPASAEKRSLALRALDQ